VYGAVLTSALFGLQLVFWKEATCKEDEDRPQIPWERAAKYLMGFKQMSCGVDLGGTTAKVVVFQRGSNDTHVLKEDRFGRSGVRRLELETPCPTLGGTLHFIKWNTESTGPAMQKISELKHDSQIDQSIVRIYATGGGAYRFSDVTRRALGWEFSKVPEFDALVDGLRFIMTHLPDSMYCIQRDGAHVPANFCNSCFESGRFPVLICNIGTGVSMLKVTADDVKRVGGTSIGGSTFLGLVYQMTSARSFDEAMSLAQNGATSEVDLLVRDIYGDNAEAEVGIPGEITASSFGRLTRPSSSNSGPS